MAPWAQLTPGLARDGDKVISMAARPMNKNSLSE